MNRFVKIHVPQGEVVTSQPVSSCGFRSNGVNAQHQARQCDDIVILPKNIEPTQARDSKDHQIDVHTFTKFYTQGAPSEETASHIVTARFDPRPEQGQETNQQDEELILRLRASLKSANMDETMQSMRVQLIEEQGGKVIVDGTSEDNDERSIHLDSIELSTSRVYIIKYEFFEKTLAIKHFEDLTVSGGHMGASSCTKPFVVQELAIVSKTLFKKRIQSYKIIQQSSDQSKLGMKENSLDQLKTYCDFDILNNTVADMRGGEKGLYCTRQTFSYPVRSSNQELEVIYDKKFSIIGAANQAVTYLFDLTLGYDFSSSAQLKAIIRRIDKNMDEEAQYVHDPLVCLLDHSCVESDQIGKGEINIDVILTPGDYQLFIIDQQENAIRQFLHQDAGVSSLPFSFELQAIPIIQNEERVMCGDKLYLTERFIQHRFIEGRGGQRFKFEDNIILSLMNSTQQFVLHPEEDMLLKVVTKEAYGINMAMTLCTDESCIKSSSQIGNTEILYAGLSKGITYYVTLDYSNSIIQLSSFFDCPHAHLSISMMELELAHNIHTNQNLKEDLFIQEQTQKSESMLATLFDSMSKEVHDPMATIKQNAGGQMYKSQTNQLLNDKTVFVYPASLDSFAKSAQSKVITQRDFTITEGTERQVMMDVYYDNQFYDLELLITSRDANEVHAHSYSGQSNKDVSLYKGAKQIKLQLEPGDYTFKVIAKLPSQGKDTEHLELKYFEFQLFVVEGNKLRSHSKIPTSLNYLGLLGFSGVDFGQLTHFIHDVVLGPREHLDLDFTLSGPEGRGPTIDVQVIETDGNSNMLDISLVDTASEGNSTEKHNPKSTRYVDDGEEGVSYESLQSGDLHPNKNYRIRILNRDPSEKSIASVKIIMTENFGSPKQSSSLVLLPTSFSEVTRIKPRVPGLKQSSFIQGSKAVMEAFKVASLYPFIPKSPITYQGKYRTGQGSDDTFMHSLPFEVKDETASIYAQVLEYSGREDLFVTIYHEDSHAEVARTLLGKYANALGPAILTKGKYILVVHPDQDSSAQSASSELIRFSLDILLEQSDIGAGDFDVVVEEVELCSIPTLPDNFNGPGFLHPIGGNALQYDGKFRLAELLEGASIKFELFENSQVNFYLQLPEGLTAEASIVRVKGTYANRMKTEDLNKGEETFLRNKEGGFEHRTLIQFREFLESGSYMIKMQAKEAQGSGVRVMPRCEPYQISIQVSPFTQVAKYSVNDDCLDSHYIPEHLEFDKVSGGNLTYPINENTVDVAYLDLKADGAGPFLFFFQIQYDPRESGVMAVSLSKYDSETSNFKQAQLWNTPQDGITQVFTVVEQGTYAIGIQSITSTASVFRTAGLSGSDHQSMHLLTSACHQVRFTYLVSSTVRGDSRQIGGFGGMMALMMNGGLTQLVEQRDRDFHFLDEFGEQKEYANCLHDDLPTMLPISKDGFDMAYSLIVQEKPHDQLDLVVESPSLLRVSVHSKNPKNQVNVFLYASEKDKNALSWTTGSQIHQTLLYGVKPQDRAYKLRIEYETLDQNDPCPKFELRIILKSTKDLVNENLKCIGKSQPPARLLITEDDFVHEQHYSFSSSFIQKTAGEFDADLQYDMILEFPQADANEEYYFDVETRSNYLTSQLDFTLFYEDQNKDLRQLGRSAEVDPPAGHKVRGSQYVSRLKLLDLEGDLADDIDLKAALIRFEFPVSELALFKQLKDNHLLEEGHELCHNFLVSIRTEKRSGENDAGSQLTGQSELMRVRWEGQEANEGLLDPRDKIAAFLEFDRNMKSAFRLLKSSDWLDLIPVTPEESGTTRAMPKTVVPTAKELSTEDPSTIIVMFPAGSLAKGWCYKMHFNQGLSGGIVHNEEKISSDLLICASKCLCDWKGTESCDEEGPKCYCRDGYTGSTCSLCADGFSLHPVSGLCEKAKKCVEAGGDETCSHHGTCEQEGNVAVCHCDKAFSDDGLNKCGRCLDALFDYPDCQIRNWIVEEPDVSCRGLSYQMPTNLFKDSHEHIEVQTLQQPDGTLNWAQRYRLEEEGSSVMRTSSKILFMVPINSMFRIYVNTLNTGALVSYEVLDHNEEVVLNSPTSSGNGEDDEEFTQLIDQGMDSVIIHQPTDQKPEDAPFTLTLEFEKKYADQYEEDNCPVVDLRVIIEPLITAQAALRCSDSEIFQAKEHRNTNWDFGTETKFIQQNIVIQSDDHQLFKNADGEFESYIILTQSISVLQSDHAMSIIATYPFAKVQMNMNLIDKSSGDIVMVEKSSSLEGGEDNKPRDLTSSHDMTSYMEISSIEQGQYELEILIPKLSFLPTKDFPTCIGFDIVAEYIIKQGSSNPNDKMYNILAVFPMQLNKIRPTDEQVIDVKFDKQIVFDDMVKGLNERFYICQLQNELDSHNIIHPSSVRKEDESTLRLRFDFSIAKIPKEPTCYKLQCSTKELKGEEMIYPMSQQTRYCFQGEQELQHDMLSQCNPHAQPKLGLDGKCICAAPYTGHDCETCLEGFMGIQKEHEATKVHHTRCVIDEGHLSEAVCNSHGKPETHRVTSIDQVRCKCEENYDGKFCDKCKDPKFAYPDCIDSDISPTIYDSLQQHSFLQKRRYNQAGYSTSAAHYFPKGALEPTIFNEECGWVDFPDDLDKIEFMREHVNGRFHLADLYVVNHKQDNLMKFKPRSIGTFKFLVQQPESSELMAGESGDPFDIEIGLYDPKEQKFLTSAVNRHLVLPDDTKTQLKFADISFEVTNEHLEKQFYVFFRALNFTNNDEEETKAHGCLSLFIEAEFRPENAECKYNSELKIVQTIEELRNKDLASVVSKAAKDKALEYTINDLSNTFFTYQDYYVPEDEDRNLGEQARVISISLQQKFSEMNTLDILVEILELDVAMDEINQDKHSPRSYSNHQGSGLSSRMSRTAGREQKAHGSYGPKCEGICLIGGEKSYNEMSRVIELGARTYFRVWLIQQSPPNRQSETKWCSNYQLLVSASKPGSRSALAMSQVLRCPADDLPQSLNTLRYLLGNDGKQKDFHYRESFRIDHLWHNQGHKIAFKLTEPSVVRVLAPIHRHLEFELVLTNDQGSKGHKVIIRAKKEDFHSTIFAQLDKGDYHLQVAFVSDAALLQLPCQTVQLEMAIMTVQNAKLRAESIKQAQSEKHETGVSDLNLQKLLETSEPITMYRASAVGWRHIEAGQEIDQSELHVPIMREGFEIAEDISAGIFIQVQSDFLLSGVNIAINNIATGQIVEDDRRGSTGKLIVKNLKPGQYELIVYTHSCLTNLPTDGGVTIKSFDLRMRMSLKFLKLASTQSGVANAAPISVHVLAPSYPGQTGRLESKAIVKSNPEIITKTEIKCLKEFTPLPDNLAFMGISGELDFSESYTIPTAYLSHEITFWPLYNQDAIRIIVTKANAKMVLLETKDRTVLAQSRSIEKGKVQLLVATKLDPSVQHTLLLEFSESIGGIDGEASQDCINFVMAMRTWDSSHACTETSQSNNSTYSTTPNGDASVALEVIDKKSITKELEIEGTEMVDIQITLDYSNTFWRAEAILNLNPADAALQTNKIQDHDFAEAGLTKACFKRKHATTYLYTNIPAGKYELILRQRYKKKNCNASVIVTIKSWKSGTNQLQLDGQGMFMGNTNVFQSMAESQERPRTPTQLPMNLNVYKFLGGQSNAQSGEAYLLWSGHIQLEDEESQNHVDFNIEKNDTVVRFYAESSEISMNLEEVSASNGRFIAGGSGSGMIQKLSVGQFRVSMSYATAHARKVSQLKPLKAQLSIMVIGPKVHDQYVEEWKKHDGGCQQSANFPLALQQHKMEDDHQLYYNYPLIKVSPQTLTTSNILQTYNFRVNVTSRMYLEVGMNMAASQVTLQMSALGQRQFQVQGKQKGNVNVLDTEVGPGDYSVQLKQATMMGSYAHGGFQRDICGIFSLQGLLDPITLMSKGANSGEIIQKGVSGCPEGTDGDMLPSQIYPSKTATRGGGELHIDATGHFMRRFRNIVFKMSREYSEISPMYDRMELSVQEDSLLHLSFQYKAYGTNEIKLALIDTQMLNQAVHPQKMFKVSNVEGEQIELIAEYELWEGHHYALMVYYHGGATLNEAGRTLCSVYDATVSITHNPEIYAATRCPEAAKDKTDSLIQDLPSLISDEDLDAHGIYRFEKVLRLTHPKDFLKLNQISKDEEDKEKGKENRESDTNQVQVIDEESLGALRQMIHINLKSNYDLRASVEFEFDQALFTLGMTQLVKVDGEVLTDETHLQSPLVFKQNDDHYKSVRRELIAEDVESNGPGKAHVLTIANRQPDILHLINPDADQKDPGCLYVFVKIYIKASMRSAEQMYAPAKTDGPALIIACIPDASPTFIHGRPDTVTADIIFNRRPFTKSKSVKGQVDRDLEEVIKLKATIQGLTSGVRSEVKIRPVSIYASNKWYSNEEFHVKVVFDISELGKSSSEKVLFAQLMVEKDLLIDRNTNQFEIYNDLKMRGLPIFVFEQNDMEQLIKEEKSQIKAAMADSAIIKETQNQIASDTMTEKSELEIKLQEKQPEKNDRKKVECLCVHGKCRENETLCNGHCDDGWTGILCDTAFDLHRKRKDKKKDFTGDGLYRPQVPEDEEMPGSIKKNHIGEQKNGEDDLVSHKAKKIEETQSIVQNLAVSHQEQLHQDSFVTVDSNVPRYDNEEKKPHSHMITFFIFAVVLYLLNQAGLLPNLCKKSSGRQYRPLGDRDEENDVDDESDGEPGAARKQLLEMSSFGAKNPADEEESIPSDQSASKRNSSFPMTNFSKQAKADKPRTTVKQAEEDDSAEKLQKELELFAQDDDDDEDRGLLYLEDNPGGNIELQQPQSHNQGDQEGSGDNEIQEYEDFFDQNT